MKKLFLGLGFLFPIFSVNAFLDISPDDPERHIFIHLGDVKIMSPFADGNFHPEKIVTRAEALAISLRAGAISIPAEFNGTSNFQDTDPNEWYAPIIARAVETEVVSTKNQFFRPQEPVTKAEFLAFLFRATKVNFNPFFGKTSNIALDVPADAWFAPHFAYAKKYQIAHLPPDQFYRPSKFLSRREVALMTFRQLRIFYGSDVTKIFVELQAQIEQFITLLRAGEADKAEFHLQRIVKLNDALARTKNNEDAVGASAISRALTHFSDSLRALKFHNYLTAIENLHLATKQTERASQKSANLAPFAYDLSTLIDETLLSFTMPNVSKFSQR